MNEVTANEVDTQSVSESMTNDVVQDSVQETVQDLSQLSDEEILATQFDEVSQNSESQESQVNQSQENQTAQVDYQAFYETMTKPFKANGREMRVENADDAIKLMQMGANYSKKMEQLKPNLGLVRLLEQHNLTDVNELSYLLDLHNKKPEAIAKLINDSQVDLYEFDGSIADGYTPTTYEMGNEPSAFEEHINQIMQSENETAKQIILEMYDWDSQSKSVVFEKPELIDVFAQQKAEGFYDKVVGAIEYERMLGRLNNVSFIDAYVQMEAKLLNQPVQPQQTNQSFIAPRPSQETLKDKRLSAGVPNGQASQGMVTDLSKLSDEQILQLNL